MLLATILLANAPVIFSTIEGHRDVSEVARCHPNRVIMAAADEKPTPHALGAEPQAQALYAVVREVDGCNVPIVLQAQIGVAPSH